MSQYYDFSDLSKMPANKKTATNERAFSVIDTPDKAYWLGYISADGSISVGRKTGYRLKISSIDYELVIGFKNFIGSDHKVVVDKRESNDSYVLSVGSKAMCGDLISLGVIENKTFKLNPPLIENNMIRHYIRGYLDGDGDICISNDSTYNRKLFSVSFYGRESMVKWMSDHLYENCSMRSSSWYKQGSIYRYKRTQNQAVKVCEYIYNDAETFLSRKKNKFLNYIGDK